MVRKCAAFALALALIAALGFAMSHAKPAKIPGASIGFSTPCVPASPTFQAAGESNAILHIESGYDAKDAGVPAGVVWTYAHGAVARGIPPPTPRIFPPLWHRPPPANS